MLVRRAEVGRWDGFDSCSRRDRLIGLVKGFVMLGIPEHEYGSCWPVCSRCALWGVMGREPSDEEVTGWRGMDAFRREALTEQYRRVRSL